MQRVLVLDKNKQPLMPCHPARARELLNKGKAAVFIRYPFTIILKEREGGDVQDLVVKIDPGSKTTGIVLVADNEDDIPVKKIVWAAELTHRGSWIKKRLEQRRGVRGSRRSRKTRYRPARFYNRTRPAGWLPPSIQSRVDNVTTWAFRLKRLSPISSISVEKVRFDTQLMQNAEISSVEYQQGELTGYEVRQYLLEKWNRKCAYCGIENVPFEIEHITPKSKGGSNRVSNLTLACHKCNQKKGNKTAAEFGYPEIQAKAKLPLRDAAVVNAARNKLCNTLISEFHLPVEIGTGGRTKYNRTKQGYNKSHWVDAACVGESGSNVVIDSRIHPLLIKAAGRQSRQMCRVDKYGLPRSKPKKRNSNFNFLTGDIVRSKITKEVGKVTVRSNGNFSFMKEKSINYKQCEIVFKFNGYDFTQRAT